MLIDSRIKTKHKWVRARPNLLRRRRRLSKTLLNLQDSYKECLVVSVQEGVLGIVPIMKQMRPEDTISTVTVVVTSNILSVDLHLYALIRTYTHLSVLHVLPVHRLMLMFIRSAVN